MTLAQDPCQNPGFVVRDVHIKTEHIIRFCDHSINVYSSRRGKLYLFVGIFGCLRYVDYTAFGVVVLTRWHV
jgi:hypothetical protein